MKAILSILNDGTRMSQIRSSLTPQKIHDVTRTYIDLECRPLNRILESMERGLGSSGIAGFITVFGFIIAATELSNEADLELAFATSRLDDENWISAEHQKLVEHGSAPYILEIREVTETSMGEFVDILEQMESGMPQDEAVKFRKGVLICLALFLNSHKSLC